MRGSSIASAAAASLLCAGTIRETDRNGLFVNFPIDPAVLQDYLNPALRPRVDGAGRAWLSLELSVAGRFLADGADRRPGYMLLDMDFDDTVSGGLQAIGCGVTQKGINCRKAVQLSADTEGTATGRHGWDVEAQADLCQPVGRCFWMDKLHFIDGAEQPFKTSLPDYVVVGGGAAGSSAAATLADHGATVLVLERGADDRDVPESQNAEGCPDVALTEASESIRFDEGTWGNAPHVLGGGTSINFGLVFEETAGWWRDVFHGAVDLGLVREAYDWLRYTCLGSRGLVTQTVPDDVGVAFLDALKQAGYEHVTPPPADELKMEGETAH
eukprot:gene29681-32979_t